VKLIELEPHWIGSRWNFVGGVRFGITFLCPHCKEVRLGVIFSNPFGEVEKLTMAKWADIRTNTKNLWKRNGQTFEDLSLFPSIDASEEGHWHGSIVNGEIQ
jgi:Family of unknown function (DUF6527)